jgi:hypothetical protein
MVRNEWIVLSMGKKTIGLLICMAEGHLHLISLVFIKLGKQVCDRLTQPGVERPTCWFCHPLKPPELLVFLIAQIAVKKLLRAYTLADLAMEVRSKEIIFERIVYEMLIRVLSHVQEA